MFGIKTQKQQGDGSEFDALRADFEGLVQSFTTE